MAFVCHELTEFYLDNLSTQYSLPSPAAAAQEHIGHHLLLEAEKEKNHLRLQNEFFITEFLDYFQLLLIRLHCRVLGDDLEIVTEDHGGEESLPPQQESHVTVMTLTPAEHQQVRVKPLEVLQQLLSPAVVRCHVHNLNRFEVLR